jgi:uncharacterized FlaG/YvyC family protein
MGVPGISAQELRAIAVPPAVRTPSHGAPDQTPKEAAPAAQSNSAVQGETKQPAPTSFSTVSGVRLHVDAETHRIIAQIVDENDNVVRQIPPEEWLRIAKLSRQLQGLLFDQKA